MFRSRVRAGTKMVDLVVSLDTRSREFCVLSTTMVIKTELWTRVHSPVVRAADCRSAGPWFNSGWKHWIHTHWHIQRNNIMSPITTTITVPVTTIPRNSVNKQGEFGGRAINRYSCVFLRAASCAFVCCVQEFSFLCDERSRKMLLQLRFLTPRHEDLHRRPRL